MKAILRPVFVFLALLLLVACETTSGPEEQAERPPVFEEYDPGSVAEVMDLRLVLAEEAEPVTVTVDVIDGLAIYQGDIVLGPVAELSGGLESQAMTTNRASALWPDGVIPFRLGGDLARQAGFSGAPMWELIADAVVHWQKETDLSFVVLADEGEDYSDFITFVSGSGCSSSVGRQGGEQFIELNAGCADVGGIIHEIGHAVGLWHEQSRGDRDDHVELFRENVRPFKWHNFELRTGVGRSSGEYDYGSIMHYPIYAFAKDVEACWSGDFGKCTILPRNGVAARSLGQRDGLSRGDIAAVAELYGPWAVDVSKSGPGTVASSPAGIHCGDTCTTTFSDGTTLTLTATPASGARFDGWGGACSGMATTCRITVSGASSVSASFSDDGTEPDPVAGALTVTPGEHLFSSGDQGGPFSPASKSYTLTNSGDARIEWRATKVRSWTSISAGSGSLEAGQSTVVTVSLGPAAADLAPGTYSDTVDFAIVSGGEGSLVRNVELTIGPTGPAPDNRDPEISRFRVVPADPEAGEEASFQWTVSDPDDDAVSCGIDFGDGTSRNISDCSGSESIRHSYGSSGTYRVNLVAIDGRGASDSANLTVHVDTPVPDNSPPRISSLTASPATSAAPSTVRFSWSVSDPDEDTLTCALNFGDGTSSDNIADCANNNSTSHLYSEEGDYTVLLVVGDPDDEYDSRTVSVVVTPGSAGGAPRITGVDPSTPKATTSGQSVEVYGEGFEYGAGVVLYEESSGEYFDVSAKASFVSSSRIDLRNIKFGEPAGYWQVMVRNDPGRERIESNWYRFRTVY